ncbi:metallophosphoesterase [Thalassoporum mexicanum PCC 7367]|uniref:metallophosphoesterase n=1 Tax=Thalassoporum mexicanum TaxID=3457544 RepID=UPI00029FFB48|nr:metallophosphoesterase [Pseudanabaena sp. PCC 7367]AFY70639.1 metallophosphoesterase [Pseudanabaena sp. PCC 7367]
MHINRRRFLLGLAGFGTSLLGQNLVSDPSHSSPGRLVPQPRELSLTAYDSLRFVAIADTGMGDDGQYAVAKAMGEFYDQSPFPLVLMAGDNIYNRGEMTKIEDCFEKPYAKLIEAGVEFRAVLGNHDIMTSNGRDQLNYEPFNMLWRYYTFRKGPVQFFGLDTNDNADWEKQLVWLEQSLARTIAPWKVVFAHHPVYSSGQHGSNAELQEKLKPIFAKHGVQLYLSGHDHNYERSQPIDGTTYIVHGGGSNIRGVGWSEHTAATAERLSFVAIEATRNSLRTSAIDVDGQVFDTSEIGIHQLNAGELIGI